jgi:hypothetical protein
MKNSIKKTIKVGCLIKDAMLDFWEVLETKQRTFICQNIHFPARIQEFYYTIDMVVYQEIGNNMSEFKIDINRADLYDDNPDIRQRTRERLLYIAKSGMTEVSSGEFGYPGVVTGLYIEFVWAYDDEMFNSFIKWAVELMKNEGIKI